MVTILILIDGLRWDYINYENCPFLHNLKKHNLSGIVKETFAFQLRPAFFAGQYPDSCNISHLFYFDPQNSPFKDIKKLENVDVNAMDPQEITRFREYLSNEAKKIENLRGNTASTHYANTANIPFDLLRFFDFSEKKNIFEQHSISSKTLFDILHDFQLKWLWIAYPTDVLTTENVLYKFKHEISSEYSFIFLHFAETDWCGHEFGPQSVELNAALKKIDTAIIEIFSILKSHFDTINAIIFGDHGMVEVEEIINIEHDLKQLPISCPNDYLYFLDSTQARFWFNNSNSKTIITKFLKKISNKGKILDQRDFDELHVNFNHNKFWDLIFVLNGGKIFLPNFFQDTQKPLGMHGYLPDVPNNDASFIIIGKNEMGFITHPISMVDIFPTLLTLMNFPIPPSSEGTSIIQCEPNYRHISVIIPTQNRWPFLEKTLLAYNNQNYPKDKFEIIIVDDGSDDGTESYIKDFIKKLNYHLQYFKQDKQGPATARNLGIHAAKGEIFIFSGDDCVPDNDFLLEHNRSHDIYGNKDIIIVGTALIHENINLTPFIDFIYRSYQCNYKLLKTGDQINFINFITTNVSIKKENLNNEFFDEEFKYASLEDTELGYRLSKKGFKFIFNDRAKVYHDHEYILNTYIDKAINIGQSLILLYKKHPELKDWWIGINSLNDTSIRDNYYDSIIKFYIILGMEKALRAGLEINDNKIIKFKDDLMQNQYLLQQDYQSKISELSNDITKLTIKNSEFNRIVREKDLNIIDINNKAIEVALYAKELEKVVGESNRVLTEVNNKAIEVALYAKELEKSIQEKDKIKPECEGFGFRSWIFRFISIFGERYTYGHINNKVIEIAKYAKDLEKSIKEKSNQISDLFDNLQQLKAHSQGQSQIIKYREEEISDLTKQLQHITEQTILLEKSIINQQNQIAKQNKDINDIKLHATGLEQLLSHRDYAIAELTNQVQQGTLHVTGLEQLLSHRDYAIAELTNQVQQVTLHAQGLEQIIKENRDNYRLLAHFGLTERIIDASNYLLNTCRNHCKLGLKALDILFHEGLRGLIKHYNDRKHIKKIETEHKIQSFGKKDILPIEKIDIKTILLPENNENPEVSIIIPVYNNVLYTLNCIRSISLNTTGPYEIIVVDDASDDLTPVLLKEINNLTIIKNGQNQGFIRSCNIGASAGKGNFILFLNNDTLVTENWLPPLLEIIKKDDVGAVGAKLIYPDGKLQEAGGIIWNDGSGWNYGRGDNPEKPEYNFVRNVDYCSGAALLVKKDIFEKIGGFDELYIPAYYEDADLCFSIRKLGYYVMYQPKSVIIHFEGISNGSDITSGIKRNQIINKEKFLQKWKDVLQKENLSPSPTNLVLARSRSSGKNILVIDQYVPFFDRDAGSYRMSNILKILAELGHRVTFIGENFNQFEPYDTIMQQAGIEVIFSPFIKSIEQYISQYGQYFDVVILSRPHIAQKHMSNIRKYCPNAKVVFDTVDLQFLRESRRAHVINDPVLLKKADELKRMEIHLAKSSDVTLVVSSKEQEILTSEDPSLNVQVISLIHELKKPDKTFSERRDMLFLGAFLHNPNVDGVLWFIEKIFPKIKSNLPDVKLFVVGDRPTKEVLSFSSEDIIVTGYVEDLTDYFNTCRVFVAPLRYGAGVKGKINQSMSHGLPVVTTTIGAEGLGITDEHNILVADDPEPFSKKVIQLYQDEELWNKLSINSIEHIRQNFSYEKSKNRIKQFIDSL